MLLVALLTMADAVTLDAEAPRLAADLGMAPYDARLLLAGGCPAIVLSTADRGRATKLADALRARGHDAATCDPSAIVPSSAMISMRRFQLDESGVSAADRAGARLPFDDLLCLLRATHRRHVESDTSTRERKFDAARAIASGGLLMTKNVSRSVTSKLEERENVLYLFRRSGRVPWILRESGTHYTALGAALRPSQHENFLATIKLLRESARGASYDERLLAMKKVPERTALSVSGDTSTIATSSEAGMDTLAHLLALHYARRTPGPYRE